MDEPEHETTLRLLWEDPPRSRGPKPSLSVAKVVHAAIGLADDEGLDAVTMRRVAEQLGVTTMALYRYVPSKSDLLALMVDAAIGEPPGFDDVVGDWRRGLARWARRSLGTYRRHPWVLELTTPGHVFGPNEAAWLDAALEVASGLGLPDQELLTTVQLVASYVRGHAQATTTRSRRTRATDADDANTTRLVSELANERRYAAVARVLAAGSAPSDDDAFDYGLQRILDGIEVNTQHAFVPGVGRTL